MKNYFRVLAGRKSIYAEECFRGGFIGADQGIEQDLTDSLPEEWREFNRQFIPIYQAAHPGASRVTAGLACGLLWTLCKGIRQGDIVLCPDGTGRYRAGEVIGGYQYVPGAMLPHRRAVTWLDSVIDRSDMSDALRRSTGTGGLLCKVSSRADEIERLIGGKLPDAPAQDETAEDPSVFALEAHLEDFLMANWAQTELGRQYDIYEENGEQAGRQYSTDTGPLDILAVSKDRKTLLVVELKRGRASDAVVGQILRYMGYVKEELAEPGQQTKGVIIAFEDDQRIRRALSVAPSIEFYRYQVSFKLIKG
ncbi:MAG: endonuclease NucS [Bryobacteraceae bacterium]